MPSASTTMGSRAVRSTCRTTEPTLLLRPRPGPMRQTPQGSSRRRTSSAASRESLPSLEAGSG